VNSVLRELFGECRTIPYTFNSEAYENEKFRAEKLALGFEGLLRFKVTKKIIFPFIFFQIIKHRKTLLSVK